MGAPITIAVGVARAVSKASSVWWARRFPKHQRRLFYHESCFSSKTVFKSPHHHDNRSPRATRNNFSFPASATTAAAAVASFCTNHLPNESNRDGESFYGIRHRHHNHHCGRNLGPNLPLYLHHDHCIRKHRSPLLAAASTLPPPSLHPRSGGRRDRGGRGISRTNVYESLTQERGRKEPGPLSDEGGKRQGSQAD